MWLVYQQNTRGAGETKDEPQLCSEQSNVKRILLSIFLVNVCFFIVVGDPGVGYESIGDVLLLVQ